MLISGAGAEFFVSGGTLNGMTVKSGGMLNAWGGTFNDLLLTQKGSANIHGATVNNLRQINNGGTPRLYVSGGGLINGGETTGTVEFWVYDGGVAKDVTIKVSKESVFADASDAATQSKGEK